MPGVFKNMMFGGRYAVKGPESKVLDHLDLLQNKGIAAKFWPLEEGSCALNPAERWGKFLVFTGEQDVTLFERQEANRVYVPDEATLEEEFRPQVTALLKQKPLKTFFIELDSLQRKYQEAAQIRINPAWTSLMERIIPKTESGYQGISPLNRALTHDQFDAQTGQVAAGFDWAQGALTNEDEGTSNDFGGQLS